MILRRCLWYAKAREHVRVDQSFLQTDPRSLIVLGEAGMGKSTLLNQLSEVDDYAFCAARKLINSPDPRALLGNATTLVIDALDEVSARHDGDAVDLVVRKLAALGSPRFVLSCRVSDWRSATALQGIADFYAETPVELHLESLDRADALGFLAEAVGEARAGQAIAHFEARGLSGLWSNPQTLELVERVAREDRLPASKGDLFAEATTLLRAEHREEKSLSALVAMSDEEVLDAAGAAFGSLLLSGKDALSRLVTPDADDLSLADVAALPGAPRVADVLDARLFAATGKDRFSYTHRAIGEFLGARWLARNADTPRKQRRLLELFGSQALVPASLRGIHAWLAWHSPALADAVVAADPMGVVEYGDADRLKPAQARGLLTALRSLSRENPRFRGWTEYRVGGLAQPALLPEIRQVLTAPDVEFGLRLLVLQALKGSPQVTALTDIMLDLLLDRGAAFALRSEAGDRLIELATAPDWPAVVQRLRAQDDEDGVRLASEIIDEVGYDRFDDPLLLDVVLAQLKRSERTVGVYMALERNLPEARLDALLDGLVSVGASNGRARHRGAELANLAASLVARRLGHNVVVEAERLWSWLQPLDSHTGYQSDNRRAIAEHLAHHHALRREVQRHALLRHTDSDIWQLSCQLSERCYGLAPTEADVVTLLDQLAPMDVRWRELVQLVSHSPEHGGPVRAAAERFITSDEDTTWLAELPIRRVPDWQIKEEQRQRLRREERARNQERHRANFAAHIDQLRAGDYGAVLNPAKAYLKLFHDTGEEKPDGPARLEEWLGTTLRDASLAGFECFLVAGQPRPTAQDIAQSYAEGRRWEAAYIIVAALGERLRTGRGFDDLPSERLMAGLIELRNTRVDNHAGLGDLDESLASVLRARDEWEAVQRLHLEPQISRGRAHVDGLYALAREPQDADLAATLAIDWLERFPEMSTEPEVELIDLLLRSEQGCDTLRRLAPRRIDEATEEERRRNWSAAGLIVDFHATRKALTVAGAIEPALLWHLRGRFGSRGHQKPASRTDPRQLCWIIETFRALFPALERPDAVTTGNTNPWDASDYLYQLIRRLGDDTSEHATATLVALRDAPRDGYTEVLRVAVAEQKRKRVEADWVAPMFSSIASTVSDTPPTVAAQLQVVLLEELQSVQAKLRGSDVDWYRDFSNAGTPRVEEECRDSLLKMLRPLPFAIEASPEGHLADDKRCDIVCTLGKMMVPIEVKGQWHPELWTAADRQLDRLYTSDWRAERGIYLVFWFGRSSPKPPANAPRGMAVPSTAAELQAALAKRSATTREGRTEIVVLDLAR